MPTTGATGATPPARPTGRAGCAAAIDRGDHMDRRLFLAGLGTAGGSFAAAGEERPATKAAVVPLAEAKAVWAMGVKVTIHADSKLTGGAYSVFEDWVPPGEGRRCTPTPARTRRST